MLKIENLKYKTGSIEICIDQFELTPGKIILLLGESGCGKSSLLKLLGGYLDADSGTITYLDKNTSVAYLMQNPRYQIIHTTVRDELLFPLKNRHLHPENSEKRIRYYSQEFHISHLLNQNPKDLSLGELQMLMLAVSFADEQSLILLDEPVSHLGQVQTACLLHQMRRVKEDRRSIILSSQDSHIHRSCDEIIVMKEGHFIAHFPADKYTDFLPLLIKEGLVDEGPCT